MRSKCLTVADWLVLECFGWLGMAPLQLSDDLTFTVQLVNVVVNG